MTPHKNECPGGAGQFANSNTFNVVDFPTDSSSAVARLKAKFLSHGHLVHDGGNDDYIVVKSDWCMSRRCESYSALVAFGRVLGVFQ